MPLDVGDAYIHETTNEYRYDNLYDSYAPEYYDPGTYEYDNSSYDDAVYEEFADAYVDDTANEIYDFSDAVASIEKLHADDEASFGVNPNDPLAEFYPGAHRNAVTEYDDEATEEELAEEAKFSDINWRVDQKNIIPERIVLDNGLTLQDEDFLPLPDKEELEAAEKAARGEGHVNLGRETPVIYCIDGGAGIFAGETKIVGPLECDLPGGKKDNDDDKNATTDKEETDGESSEKLAEPSSTVNENSGENDELDNSEELDSEEFAPIIGADELGVEGANKSKKKQKKTKESKKKLTPEEKEKAKKFGSERLEGHIITKVNNEGVLLSDKAKSKFKHIKRSRLMFEGDRSSIQKRFFGTNLRDYMIYMACLLVILGCGWFAYDYFEQNLSADDEFNDVGNTYTMPEMLDVASQEPDTSTSWPPIVDWKSLKEQYPDVAAWLRIPGTSVDYPVLTNEMPDYYLHRSMSGAYSMPGSIFADFENTNDLGQEHIVLYGHHMIYPSMFHDVAKYKDPSFFEQHRVIYLETPETTYVLRPIGMYYISPEEYNVRSVLFRDGQTFQSYLDDRLARPDVIRYDDYNRETLDMLVTLITCSDDGKARQIVECVPEQSYPTSMIPAVIERGEAEIRGEWVEK